MEEVKVTRHIRPSTKEVFQRGDVTEIITSCENLDIPDAGTVQPTQPAQPTPEQLMRELEAWLAERNAVILQVAIGIKTNQLANIKDWEPDTHVFSYVVVPKGKQQ